MQIELAAEVAMLRLVRPHRRTGYGPGLSDRGAPADRPDADRPGD